MLLRIDRTKFVIGGEVEKANSGGCDILKYLARRENGDILIEPDWEIWEAWNKGGPIGSAGGAGGLDFNVSIFAVYLEVRVFDPGTAPLSIVGAEVEGESSRPDLEPILDIGDDDAASIYGGLHCAVTNFKDTRVKSCDISYNVQPPTEEPKYGDYKFRQSLAAFKGKAEFSIGEAVDSLGIDSKAIALIDEFASKSAEQDGEQDFEKIAVKQRVIEAKVKKGLGAFAKHASFGADGLYLRIRVTGEMRVGWDDDKGNPATRTVTFTFHKTLAMLWPEYGAGAPSFGKFDITLPVSVEGYSKPFPFRKTVKQNGSERFTLKLACEASTRHAFRVRLTTADGSRIVSPPCKLTYLIPSGFSWKDGFVGATE